jgi:8-oxo-dGTP pyrophosphatase MutT (NUDIX family)
MVEVEQRENVLSHGPVDSAAKQSRIRQVIDNATANSILARLGRALAAAPTRIYHPLRVDSANAGWLDADRATRARKFTDVFAVDRDGLSFHPTLRDESSRSEAMARVAATLAAEGALTKWRNELYAVAPTFGAPPWFRLERAAARYFGVHTWAAHINGVVRDRVEPRMWFARRSADKAIDPLKLDNLVGGGIAAGATIAETIAREAWEEAGIPRELASQSLPAGALHIRREQGDGLQSETIFVHDLWLPAEFVPANQDGEAIEHRLVAMNEAARLIALSGGQDEVTADASLVVLDFLLRQDAIGSASPIRNGLQQLLHTQAAARRA